VALAKITAEQDGTQVQLKMWQHVVWGYYLTDVDTLAYGCTPSYLYDFLAQEPCSPFLGSSKNPGNPKHKPTHHSSHLRNIHASFHQCQLYVGHREAVE
jgi:hypothetical protein